MATDPLDLIFVLFLVIFIWIVLEFIDGNGGGGKRTRIPVT